LTYLSYQHFRHSEIRRTRVAGWEVGAPPSGPPQSLRQSRRLFGTPGRRLNPTAARVQILAELPALLGRHALPAVA